MLLLYILFAVYILAINFYSFRLLKTQREDWEDGKAFAKTDGKLILSAFMGGAIAIYASMFFMRFRLSNLLLMVLMPLVAVLNVYCFYLGYRGIFFFF